MTLRQLLADNGLGAFAEIFAAQQITLETVGDLDVDDLREMNIPIGPRKKLLRLFAKPEQEPQRPVQPVGSHSSPRHAALQAATGGPVTKDSGKKFSCFLLESRENRGSAPGARSSFCVRRSTRACVRLFVFPSGPDRLFRRVPLGTRSSNCH